MAIYPAIKGDVVETARLPMHVRVREVLPA
jgi:hypothetical protein